MIEEVLTVGRAVVCSDCGHLKAAHEPNGCLEVLLARGGIARSCPCPGFVPLDAA